METSVSVIGCEGRLQINIWCIDFVFAYTMRFRIHQMRSLSIEPKANYLPKAQLGEQVCRLAGILLPLYIEVPWIHCRLTLVNSQTRLLLSATGGTNISTWPNKLTRPLSLPSFHSEIKDKQQVTLIYRYMSSMSSIYYPYC